MKTLLTVSSSQLMRREPLEVFTRTTVGNERQYWVVARKMARFGQRRLPKPRAMHGSNPQETLTRLQGPARPGGRLAGQDDRRVV
jgi:hypothetical protein